MAPRKKESTEEVATKKYEHYIRPVPVLENFEEIYKLNYHLIKSYDELLDFYKTKFKANSFFAWDTETTSLNPEQGEKTGDLVEGKIVGYSFTQDGHNGYYVPLAHPDYAIGYKGLKVLYAMVCKSKLNLLYNARFDIRFLEFMTPEKYDYTPEPGEKIYNFDLSKIKYLDVQCATWLADTNVPMPSLKKSEKHFLGWIPPTFAETTGNETNFGYLPAEQGYRYACIEENTLIKTTNGDKKIKDITVNDTVYSSSGPNKVLAVYNNGIKHTIKCTYKNDYTLVCTPDHRIAVNTVLGPRLVQAKDLDKYVTLYTGGINFNDLSNLSQDYSTLSFNVSSLQNIDFMYWLLGFTMTDGNLVNNRLAYRVQKRDEHVLYDIKNYVKSQSKIFETLSKSPSGNSINTAVNLYICNKTCCNFMREHGMTENKSTRKSYTVSDDVFPSFLRGIYDGDGSSNGNNICFIGYPEFIEKLQSDIYRLYGLTSSLHRNKLDDKVIVMTFTKYASLQLMNIMYNGATIFNKRKMEKALRKHKLFYVSKCNNYKKRANYTEIAREPVGVEEFQKLDHICKSFNIGSSALSRVVSGRWKQYKGLTVTTNIGKLYKIAPCTMTIEDIGDKQVFDLQIENDPSFITSNGFIVHNCIDALGTYHLFFKTERFFSEAGAAGKLDNESLYPLMKLENTPIYIDHDYLVNIRKDIVKRLDELREYLYTTVGKTYNINSGRELIGVFQTLGIDTGKRTKTGLMETNIKAIENYLVSHGDNEYLNKLIEYKKLLKFDNSYLEKLIKMSEPDEVKNHPVRFCYFTTRVPCLTENNRVLIKDKGLVSIKECKAGDYIWTQYGYKKILWNNSHFANDLYKVTFKNGYTIEGTGHHPVLVNKTGRSTYLKYEWAGLSDLKPDEHIVLNHKSCENYDTDIEYDFARLIGFIDGDGSIATSDRVKLCYWTGESDELKEYYGNLLSHYSNSDLHYDLSQKESHHAIVQAVYNTKFNTYLHSLGVRGDGVPKCILNSSPKIWLAYLQGIWDSDGNISLNNDNRKCPQVGIKLIKKQTVRDIGLMLLMLGIPNTLLNINYYKYKSNCHEQLRCRVRDHIGYVLFKNLISDYMKSNKRLKFESLNIDDSYIEYAQTTVKSVEKIPDAIVYDIEVEGVHEYIANGIVTHNTGRLASGTDGKNSFFSQCNFQSLPKPHSHNYHVHKATKEQIENNEDLCGWIFNDDPTDSLGLTEGQDPHLNVRKCFHGSKDEVVVSVDMCLEGGSPVQSKRGYIGISDLKVDDEIFTPDGYVKVTRIKNTGAKTLYKIKTNGQAIYCSEDHPFMINNQCVPANKINNVLIQEKIPTYIEYNIKKTDLFNKFKALKDINSIVEKANYIKNNNLIDDFIKAYNNYTAADTAKMCFIKNSSFRHIINYLNLNDKCNKDFCSVQKQHVFNPFKTSNPTSAYLLGYILGDGNINIRRNNYYTLNITSKDYAHINQIKNIFDDTIKLSEHTKNNHKAWSLTIVDQDVCNDLIKLGIKPRKSYADSTINFEWLGNNFNHFIRGLFDADGCIRIKSSNSLEFTIAGNHSYINEIYNHMSNQWSCYKSKNENISILNKLWSNTDKRDFYKYLYTNATIWLQHKRDIFDEYIINNFHQLPEFEMYDITIDSKDHVYFCNGILTHNCAEELRLVANVFKEQTWIHAFNTGQDVHKLTAIKIFGEENYCKEARKKAKCISGDSLLYTDSGIIPIREVNSSRTIGEPVDVDFKLATPEGFCKCSKFIYNGIKQTLKFNMNNGDTLEVTPDHLIRSNNKWVYAKDLKEKDFIDFESIETFNNKYQYINLTYITNATFKFTKEQKRYQVLSIEKSESDVYDLTIENESHSFLANGFVVHNCASFGILYGSSAYGFHNQFPDMSIEECEQFMDDFKKALPSIEAGQKAAVRFARKNGYVKTYFGRPRRVKYYLEHPDRSMRGFGERTCKNTVVQGCAGDALKLMIIRLWNELFLKYPEVKWIGTIHDEINYIVPKYLLNEVVPIIMKCQTIKLPDWPVVLEPDLSIGDSFGSLIPFYITYNDDGTVKEFTPQMEEIKNDKLHETNEEEEYNLLLENDDYDYMQ